MAPHCQFVLVFTSDIVPAGQELCCETHGVRLAPPLLLWPIQRVWKHMGPRMQLLSKRIDALGVLEPEKRAAARCNHMAHAEMCMGQAEGMQGSGGRLHRGGVGRTGLPARMRPDDP